MAQHKKSVEKKESHRSALAGHALNFNHRFDFENPFILDRHNQLWKREFLEELHIYSNKKCVNIKSKESKNVSSIYANILKKCADGLSMRTAVTANNESALVTDIS